jgi:hypothetical protein
MSIIRNEPLTGPAVWKGPELARDTGWIHHLKDAEVAEIDADGKLSCRYLRQYTELGHEIRSLPLSRVEIEALDLFDATMHDPALRLDMLLEPGDLQFANNYAVLHSRTDFEDAADPTLHRRMLRLWLKMPNARTLAPEFPGRNGFPAPEVGLTG